MTHHHHHHHHHHHGRHPEELSQQLHNLVASSPVPPEPTFNNPEEVWTHLMEGNSLYTSGHYGGYLLSLAHGISDTHKASLRDGQKPHAIVVCCSDSRCAPELLFNQGLGHIFVVRVAGNVIDPIALGSIEYAVEHLHSQLIVILGHQKCGAVKAAVETHGTPLSTDNSISAILAKIHPAVEQVKGTNPPAENLVDLVVRQNVKNTEAEILAKSHIVKEHVEQGTVAIHTAHYSLDTGKVDLVG